MADDVLRLSVAEAARHLRVSTGTVHRRIRAGELFAEREPRPQGSRLWVLLPASMLDANEPDNAAETHPGASGGTSAVEAELRSHVETLKQALDAEQRSGAELRQLLGREQQALLETRHELEAVRHQLLIQQATDVTEEVTDDVSRHVPVEAEQQERRRGFWRRLFGG